MHALLPRHPVPALNVALVGGGRHVLGAARGERFDLVVFYRGLHCPICAKYLMELERLAPEFAQRGVSIPVSYTHLPATGEYTRLTRFLPGADTSAFGGKSHAYPEEVFIVSGRLHDAAFDLWLEAGHYASRPPGEVHGPFHSDVGCVVLEVSFPNRVGG